MLLFSVLMVNVCIFVSLGGLIVIVIGWMVVRLILVRIWIIVVDVVRCVRVFCMLLFCVMVVVVRIFVSLDGWIVMEIGVMGVRRILVRMFIIVEVVGRNVLCLVIRMEKLFVVMVSVGRVVRRGLSLIVIRNVVFLVIDVGIYMVYVDYGFVDVL